MPTPTLVLDPDWEVTEANDIKQFRTPLGDGYKQIANADYPSRRVSWNVSKTGLSQVQLDNLMVQLELFAGATSFAWQPGAAYPLRTYYCDEWQVKSYDVDCWQISGKFIQDFGGECVELLVDIDEVEINGWLTANNSWLATQTRNTLPLIINTVAGKPYLLVNSFHDVLGRGGYFPGSAGTTEGQFLMIRGCLAAWAETGVTSWKQRAIDMAEALEPVLYRGQLVPSDPNVLWLPHWVYNVKTPFVAKGKNTAPDPLNYGYFGIVVSFASGVGQISTGAPNDGEKLSDVYSVYATTAKLLWQNVYAPVVFGQQYEVEYWVVNFMLGGQNYRIYPTTAASNGTSPTVTAEPAGKIKLVGTFSGSLKVTYAAYTGGTIAVNQAFDPYPFWRSLLAGEINSATDVHWWAYDAYQRLYAATGLTKWANAAAATRQSTISTAVVNNPTNWYKREADIDPFSYPGTQVVQVDNANGFTASRETVAALLNALKLVVAVAPAGGFPSIEVQNFAVQAKIESGVTILAQVAQSATAVIRVAMSLATNAFDQSQLYYLNWLIPGGSSAFTVRSFLPEDFFRWESYLVWHLAIADNPLYSYSGAGGFDSTYNYQDNAIAYNGKTLSQCVGGGQINAGASGYAGIGLVLIGKPIRRPPKIAFTVTKDVILRITDGSNFRWDCPVAATTVWTFRKFQWGDFSFSPASGGSDPGSPDSQNDILNIEFIAINSTGTAGLGVWWVAENDRNEPEQLPVPCIAFKAAVVSRSKLAHTFWVGNFRPVGSTSDALQYNPGVLPFTVNIVGGNVDAWRGLPYTGYQDPELWYQWGLLDRCQQVIAFLDAAQGAYTASTGVVGGFAPVFKWGYWDGGDYTGGLNSFSWDGADPNGSWGQYGYRPLEATAKYWAANPGDTGAGKVVMSFLTMMDRHYLTGDSRPFTDFKEGVPPSVGYHDPAASALIGRAAVYANLAGGNPAITFRIIKKTCEHLRGQWVSSGNMAGTWTASQSTFMSGGQTYSEWFGFWNAEILLYLALLLEQKSNLRLPPCGQS